MHVVQMLSVIPSVSGVADNGVCIGTIISAPNCARLCTRGLGPGRESSLFQVQGRINKAVTTCVCECRKGRGGVGVVS